MRGVMLDAMELAAYRMGRHIKGGSEIFANARKAPHHAHAVERKLRHADREAQFRPEARPRIARHRDMIDFGELDAGTIEAELNRLRRQAGRVFHAIQPLFFDGSDKPAVHHNRSGGIRVIGVNPKNDHRIWKLPP